MKKLIIMGVAVVLWFDLMGIAAVKGAERAHHRECVCEGDRCDEDCKGCDKCEKCMIILLNQNFMYYNDRINIKLNFIIKRKLQLIYLTCPTLTPAIINLHASV